MLKKYIADKDFYKKVFAMILPIMLQQLFLSIAGYVDGIMINSYGATAAAYNGVSAANKLIYVCNFVWIGIISAVSIFTAQYYGAGNKKKVKETARLSLYTSVGFAIISFFVIIFFGNKVVDSYIIDETARQCGYQYLDIIKYGNFFIAVGMSMASVYRSVQRPHIPLVIGIVGIAVNIFLNWTFIFGHLGFEAMGAKGAAIATVISKVVEVILYIIVIRMFKVEWLENMFESFKVSSKLLKNFAKRGTPIILNELSWSISMILLTMFYTYHNDVWYNAFSYTQNISDLFFIVFSGLGNGTAIIIGASLGQSKFEQAEQEMNYFRGIGLAMGVVVGGSMMALSPVTSMMFTKDPEMINLMCRIMRVTACFAIVYCFNAVSFFTLRAGGDSLRAVILDQGPTYLLGLPVAIILGVNAASWGIDIVIVYLASHIMDISKIFMGNFFLRKRVWLKNLAVEEEIPLDE